MEIDPKQTIGCDKTSYLYGMMFNVLQETMEDENKLKKLSPPDFSALGMYIGKFVEQEINSSVVQIMRAYCGIDMPDYYCKRYPGYDVNADVVIGKKTIRLNEQRKNGDRNSLKFISLGDAYYALEELKKEDKEGFFNDYPWLNDKIFLEAWRNLFTFRNRMAHIGEIITIEILKENYMFFLRFLKYIPDILAAKKKLAPDDYIESLPTTEPKEEFDSYILTEHIPGDLPIAPKEVALRFVELLKELSWQDDNCLKEINDIQGKYDLDAIIFAGSNGKKGIKDCIGNILVPAKYDGFGILPNPFYFKRESVNAVRDGKFVVVAFDGSGRELTKGTYDEIRLATYHHPDPPYVYRKNGLTAWGFMTVSGVEICDCIIDEFACGLDSMWYKSGDLVGYWQIHGIFLPPIYDNIEMPGEFEDPLLFTLNGVQGYVRNDGSFFPKAEFDKMDEDEQIEERWNLLREQDDL